MFWDLFEIASSGFGPGPETNFQPPTIIEVITAFGLLVAFILNIVLFKGVSLVYKDVFYHSPAYDAYVEFNRRLAVGVMLTGIIPT